MTVVWTDEARDCLARIRDYIAEDSAQAAKKLVERLMRRGEQLEVAPLSGRRVPEYPEQNLRELLERPYRIIYRQMEDRVEIVSVMALSTVATQSVRGPVETLRAELRMPRDWYIASRQDRQGRRGRDNCRSEPQLAIS